MSEEKEEEKDNTSPSIIPEATEVREPESFRGLITQETIQDAYDSYKACLDNALQFYEADLVQKGRHWTARAHEMRAVIKQMEAEIAKYRK